MSQKVPFADHTDHTDRTDHTDHTDRTDHTDHMDHTDHTEHMDHTDRKDHMDYMKAFLGKGLCVLLFAKSFENSRSA